MDKTMVFIFDRDKNDRLKKTLKKVYRALSEKGYNPVNQIVGYILSEDPTYITAHDNARALMTSLDRDEILQTLVKDYLEI